MTIIYSFIRWWIGSGIFDRIKDLVIEMMNSDKSNEEKRLYVITKVLSEYAMLKTRFVDLVISTVLIKLKDS
jgi:hypothetical protein